MNISEYIEKMKKTQEYLLRYIEEEENNEENFENLTNLFKEQNIYSNRLDLKTLLHILNRTSKHHHRTTDFFGKIERVFLIFKEKIKNFFTNSEIFTIFKSNKRILLFLFEEKIITIDDFILSKIMSDKYRLKKYPQYFKREIKPFINDDFIEKYQPKDPPPIIILWDSDESDVLEDLNEDEPEDFLEKRKIGENDNEISKIIRNDLIEEFIIYVNKDNCSLDSCIDESIYETNSHLLGDIDEITLIEYAAFFGSTQIFKYLYKNEVKLTDSLWNYAIHGDDSEIISILKEENIQPPNNSYEICIKECIKCHHDHIVNYIIRNLMNEKYELNENIDFENNYIENIVSYCFHYYNFAFFPKKLNNIYIFCYACQYDYIEIVKYLMNIKEININQKVISKMIV